MNKVLFITNELYPDMNANSEIVYRIAKELQKNKQCETSIMGYHNMLHFQYKDNPFGIRTVSMNGIDDFSVIMQNGESKYLRLLRLLLKPRSFRFYQRQRKYAKQKYLFLEYRDEIKYELKKNKYDCIVAVSHPIEITQALMTIETEIPILLYKLDPWSTHYQRSDDMEMKVCNVTEEEADQKSGAIITTDIIFREYYLQKEESLKSKVYALEFPNVIRYEPSDTVSLCDGKVNLVFAGGFYKDIRNPEYVLKLFEKFGSRNVVFHIVGGSKGDGIIPEQLPDNIICHGKVSSEEAMAYMQAADVLVNVGNTVLNQMPSKILTYISLGKPILNIIKSPECPTLPYMEKYPLALNIYETPEVQEQDVDRVLEFICSSGGKQIPFEEIEKLYHTCTPDYVGKQVYEIICKVVEEKKGNK